MATPKQLAALKKARATRAKNLAGKSPAKKISVTAKSRVTKKAPSARLKKRRAANVKAGYFPNPVKAAAAKFIVEVKTNINKIGYLTANGTLDTLASEAAKFSQSVAEKRATDFFTANKRYLVHVRVVAVKKSKGTGYATNPVPASKVLKIREAAKLYENFSGHEADYYDEVPVTWPDVALKVGLCDGIMYETIRDGKVERYVHKFRKNARPVLTASHDGNQLAIIGGKYNFTDRGIVDN